MNVLSAMFIGVLVMLCMSSSHPEQIGFDPYQVFGIRKSARSEEIRKMYKKLVKEWHPDKNKSPEAEETFIRIQQAYEILSDDVKRKQYDEGGYSGDTGQEWHRPSEGFHFKYQDFDYNFHNSQDNRRTILPHQFYQKVLPGSYSTPQVLYVYSTFCMQCVLWLRTSWQKAATDLENLGVSVSTVDTTFGSQIASRLGVNRVPTIVGIYKEKLYYFKGEINKDELKEFINSFLPSHFITKVTSYTAPGFLEGIQQDDKPRAILFTDKSSPTLLYTLLSIKYQQYIKFGFVDQRDKESLDFTRQMKVNKLGPTFLIFKENTDEPAVVLVSSKMLHGSINEILSANKFVVVPRLTSQRVLDELCPSPIGGVHTVTLCLILVSDPAYGDYNTILGTLRTLMKSAHAKEDSMLEWLKVMHVHASGQPEFVKSLRQHEKETSEIFIIWRQSPNRASVLTYDVKFLRDPKEAERGFQLCLREALEASHLQRFTKTVSLGPLVDELAPNVILKTLGAVIDFTQYFYNFVRNMQEKSLMFSVMFIFLIVSWINSMLPSSEERPPNRRNNQRTNGQNRRGADNDLGSNVRNPTESNRTEERTPQADIQVADFVRELVPSNYESLVLRMKRGHMTYVLLLDIEEPVYTSVLKEYEDTMAIHARDPKTSITHLNIREYSSWYFEMRRTSSAEPPKVSEHARADDSSTLHGSEEFEVDQTRNESREFEFDEVHGTVLAINGARHWYCIFTPRGVKLGKPSAPIGHAAAGGDSPVEETYEEALSCWLDRVREGQMPRLYVRQWPGLYIHPNSNMDDEDEY